MTEGRSFERDTAVIAAMERDFARAGSTPPEVEDFSPVTVLYGLGGQLTDLAMSPGFHRRYASPTSMTWGHGETAGLYWSGAHAETAEGEDPPISKAVVLRRLREVVKNQYERARLNESAIEPDWLERVEDDADRMRVELDLRYVMSRLERVYPRRQAKIWMDSYNQHLDAKPIDVVIFRSVAEVIRALEVVEQQAY